MTITKLDPKKIRKAALKLRALNHGLRKRILVALDDGEMTVTDLYVNLRMEQSVVSQHLAILLKQNMVVGERSGKFIYYRVNTDEMIRIAPIVSDLAACFDGSRKPDHRRKKVDTTKPSPSPGRESVWTMKEWYKRRKELINN